jgi:hypothetical protein
MPTEAIGSVVRETRGTASGRSDDTRSTYRRSATDLDGEFADRDVVLGLGEPLEGFDDFVGALGVEGEFDGIDGSVVVVRDETIVQFFECRAVEALEAPLTAEPKPP